MRKACHMVQALKSHDRACVCVCRYVFDGKPPELKSGELEKRKEKRDEAQKDLAKAQESGECWVFG